jgi:hypothetical protein
MEECPICYDKITSGYVKTNCSHIFCYNCYEKTVQVNNKCPLCREIILNDMVSISYIDNITDQNYEDGWIEGFEAGCSQTEVNMQAKINIENMKLNVMRNKYTKLKKVYTGTVIQLQNTHTLNMDMKKCNGNLPRSTSYDSYLN